MKQLVTSDAHKHFSVRALALHAARIGAVFASPSTWYRTIRHRGWLRPKRTSSPCHVGQTPLGHLYRARGAAGTPMADAS